MKFSFDTNAFIQPWRNRYPIDLFPAFWEEIEELADKGVVLASEEVFKEIEKKDDDLKAWLKKRPQIFRDIDEEVQRNLINILKQYPRLIDSKKNRSMADPFVIAQAIESKAIVVTEEGSSPGSKSPKIPDVCKNLKIPCINILTFMREIKIKFSKK
ncbi:DUF4411 family protein [Candidatus Riflebacteria bacterium]